MKVVHIMYPYVITDDGNQIAIDGIEGTPRVGSELIPAEAARKLQDLITKTKNNEELLNYFLRGGKLE